jgi:hypothetical protein
MSEDLKVPLRVLDIDDQKQESLADKLVEQYGDFSSITKARLVDLFKSEFYQTLLKTQNESSQRNI